MSDMQRLPEKGNRITDFQTKYNSTSKTVAQILGKNMALFIAMLLPMFLIGTVWTDFGVPEFGVKFLSEGIVTVALFVIGQSLMMRVGSDGGKLDGEYISAREEFDTLVKGANNVGTMLMAIFCEWQIDLELKQATDTRLRALRMSKEDVERAKQMTRGEIIKRWGKKKAIKMFEIYRLEPIELSPEVLLYDSAFDNSRGGVPIGGEKYLHKKLTSPKMVLSCIFMGLVTVSVAITLTADASFSRIMYTVFKLIILLFQMASGYNAGAKAYNTVEARQLRAKSTYLRQYVRFVEDKTYLKIGDKYGDINCFVNEEA